MDHPFLNQLRQRVLVVDGAMGTSVYARNLSLEADYRGCENCPEVLNLSRPDVIAEIHDSFLTVGVDCIETNTFGGNKIVLAEFGLEAQTREVNRIAAEVARRRADAFSTVDQPRFVLGSMGPGTRLPSLGHTTFDILEDSYAEQSRGLLEGGVDALIIETCQDILQAKTAICGAARAMAELGRDVPIIVQVTMEVTGTMLVGTEIGAAMVALEAYPQVQVIGLNCATGPQEMAEHVRHLCRNSTRMVSVVPNAGLPQLVNGCTHYALTPAELSRWLRDFIVEDGVNLVGGCCGTTPEHLAAVVQAVRGLTPKARESLTPPAKGGRGGVLGKQDHLPTSNDAIAAEAADRPAAIGGTPSVSPNTPPNPPLAGGEGEPSVSSLYQAVPLRQESSFLIIGERCNTNGSRKFKNLLAAGDMDGLVEMAREQVREGSHVLDVCVDYVGRDGVPDMDAVVARFVKDVTAPLVMDSTEAPVLEAGLKRAGGKCIVNSVNLEDGEAKLESVCPLLRKYGAAVVALTIDEHPEEAMAKSAARKIEIASRLHDLLTRKYGIPETDILFDCLTFPVTTGTEADRRLALETLDGIEKIMRAYPKCGSVLGVSNVSFGLVPAARAVLNSVFLHEALTRGLTAAIVHSSKILPRNQISDERWNAALDLIYDRRLRPSSDTPPAKGGPGGVLGTQEGSLNSKHPPNPPLAGGAKDAPASAARAFDPLHFFIGLFSENEKVGETAPIADLQVEERLKKRIIDGNRIGLEKDLDEAMQTYPPLDIINTFLLDGMKVVGDLFGSGKMQLPFVLSSAETMKAAVAHLEPHMERAGGQAKGSIVLATVRGDVHDIGKNLVDIILTNNGYKVYNLGIKQPIANIIDAFEKHHADAIGLSGLLVKSTLVMRDDLHVLNERGLTPRVILGGAALTRGYVENDLRNIYHGQVTYAKDAFEGLALMDRLAAGKPLYEASAVAAEAKPKAAASTMTRSAVKIPSRSAVATNNPIPSPPFWGSRVIEQVSLQSILPFINEKMLFGVQWQYRKQGRESAEYQRFLKEEVRPILYALAQRCAKEKILQPQAIYGYWPCNSDGDDLIIYEPPIEEGFRVQGSGSRVQRPELGFQDLRSRHPERSEGSQVLEAGSSVLASHPSPLTPHPSPLKELVRFTFPRQQQPPFWCLSDFWRPVDSGKIDVAAFTIVTVGRRASDVAREWFEQNLYRDYLHLHGLSVETAEAFAEYIHKQIRMEWGIADKDSKEVRRLFQQGYQGSRYSFGYPACPNLEDQAKLWPLLDPARIGITLSEEFQLDPEQSTSAIVTHHPEARYFGVKANQCGPVGRSDPTTNAAE